MFKYDLIIMDKSRRRVLVDRKGIETQFRPKIGETIIAQSPDGVFVTGHIGDIEHIIVDNGSRMVVKAKVY